MICHILKWVTPAITEIYQESDEVSGSCEWRINRFGDCTNCSIPPNFDPDVWAEKFFAILKKGRNFGFVERRVEGLLPDTEYKVKVVLDRDLGRHLPLFERSDDPYISISIGDFDATMELTEDEKTIEGTFKTDANGCVSIQITSTDDELFVKSIDATCNITSSFATVPEVSSSSSSLAPAETFSSSSSSVAEVLQPTQSSSSSSSVAPIPEATFSSSSSSSSSTPSSTSSSSSVDEVFFPDYYNGGLFIDAQSAPTFSVALKDSGRVWAWGEGTQTFSFRYGEDGELAPITLSLPEKVREIGPLSDVDDIEVGLTDVVAKRNDGILYEYGVRLDGTFNTQFETIKNPKNESVSSFNYRNGYGVALTSSGRMFEFGETVGSESSVTDQDGVRRVYASGYGHNMAITSDGNIFAWGKNSYGQLGLSDTAERDQIVSLPLGNIDKAYLGDSVSFIVTSDKEVLSFGKNDQGQLGVGGFIDKSIPSVIPDHKFKKIAVGDGFVVGIKTNGRVFTWGRNDHGQLGHGNRDTYSSPEKVAGVTLAQDVVCGKDHVVLLKSNGDVLTWGNNKFGQIGNGRHGAYALKEVEKQIPITIQSGSATINIADHFDQDIGLEGGLPYNKYSLATGLYSVTTDDTKDFRQRLGTYEYEISGSGSEGVSIDYRAGGIDEDDYELNTEYFFEGSPEYYYITEYDTVNITGPDIDILLTLKIKYYESYPLYYTDKLTTGDEDANRLDYYKNLPAQLGRVFFDDISEDVLTPVKVLDNIKEIKAHRDTSFALSYNNKCYMWGDDILNRFGRSNAGKFSLIRETAYKHDTYRRPRRSGSGTVEQGLQLQTLVGYAKFYPYLDNPEVPDLYLPDSPVVIQNNVEELYVGPLKVLFGYSTDDLIREVGIVDVLTQNPRMLTAFHSFISWNTNMDGARPFGQYIIRDTQEEMYQYYEDNPDDFWNIVSSTSAQEVSSRTIETTDVKKIGTLTDEFMVLKSDGNVYSSRSEGGSFLLTYSDVKDFSTYENVVIVAYNDGSTAVYDRFSGRSNEIGVPDIGNVKEVYAGYSRIVENGSSNSFARNWADFGALTEEGTYWEFREDFVERGVTPLNGMTAIKKISFRGDFAIILRENGTVYQAHKSMNGVVVDQLDIGNVKDVSALSYSSSYEPTAPDQLLAGVEKHTYFILLSNGNVLSFGDADNGVMGNYTNEGSHDYTDLQQVDISNVKELGGGYGQHMFVITSENKVFGWGRNEYSQLGHGFTFERVAPIFVGAAPILSEVNDIAAGGFHSLALAGIGIHWGWGLNDRNQLGDAKIQESYVNPIDVGAIFGLPFFENVEAGQDHSVYLRSDGDVYVSGTNNTGQIGLGERNFLSDGGDGYVTLNSNIDGVENIACGYYHTLFLKDGKVHSTGNNAFGQVGTGDIENVYSPVEVVSLDNVVSIDAGDYHSLALDSSGDLYGWGDNFFGQLIGRAEEFYTSPDRLLVNNVRLFAGGTGHTIVIKNDGSAWSWGTNRYGELGHGNVTTTVFPTPVVEFKPFDSAQKVANGPHHNFLLTSEGDVYSWGENAFGQLFTQDRVDLETPEKVRIIIAKSGINSVHAIDNRTFFSIGSDELLGTGINDSGQLADKTTTDKLSLSPSYYGNVPLTSVDEAIGGSKYTLYLRSNGEVHYSGSDIISRTISPSAPVTSATKIDTYDLGVPPVQYEPLSYLRSVKSIKGNDYNYGMLTSDGKIIFGGDNTYFQRGPTTSGVAGAYATPNLLPPAKFDLANMKKLVTAGERNAVMLNSGGEVFMTGTDKYALRGTGVFNGPDAYYPVKIDPLSSIMDFDSNGESHIALTNEGDIFAWGEQRYGQLGDGFIGNGKSNPVIVASTSIGAISGEPFYVAISGGNHMISVDVGETHTGFVSEDGYAWMTGNNSYGQLGIGNTSSLSIPVTADIADVTSVRCGHNFTLFLKDDGTVWGSGQDTSYYGGSRGVLGRGFGVFQSSNTPVQVQGISGVESIFADYSVAVAIKSDGTAWAWGSNIYGNLGVGYSPYDYYTDPALADEPKDIPFYGPYGSGPFYGPYTWYSYTYYLGPYGNWYGYYPYPYGGYGGYGGEGSEPADFISVPLPIDTTGAIKMVAIGSDHMFLLKQDGAVEYTGPGEGYYGSPETSPIPVSTSGPKVTGPVQYIANASDGYGSRNDVWSFIADANGNVAVQGSNYYGQLGNGDYGYYSDYISNYNEVDLFLVVDFSTGVKDFEVAEGYNVVLTSKGELFSVGRNDSYQLGDGTAIDRSNPVLIGEGVSSIAGPNGFLKDDGSLWKWGDNTYGQLGNGNNSPASSPIMVVEDVQEAYATIDYSLIKKSDLIQTWGKNDSGQLGTGDTTDRNSPVTIDIGETDFDDVKVYDERVIIRRGDDLILWGDNSVGQIGTGGSGVEVDPFTVTISDLSEFSASNVTTFAVNSDGNIYFWGSNLLGEYGNDTNISFLSSTLASDTIKYKDIAVGDRYSAMLTQKGDIHMAGANNAAQLGIGTFGGTNFFRELDLESVDQIVSGFNHMLAVTSDSQLYAWGENTYGKVYSGTSITGAGIEGADFQFDAVMTPFSISGMGNVMLAEAGENHTVVLKDDGTLWVWGDGTYGQLGDGRNGQFGYPIKVATDVADVKVGANHTVILKNNGEVYTTGKNDRGQIGNGTFTNVSTPTLIMTDVIKIGSGHEFVVAEKSDGTVWAWGRNDKFQMADELLIDDADTPVQLFGIGDIDEIYGGQEELIYTNAGVPYIWGAGRFDIRTVDSLLLFDDAKAVEANGLQTAVLKSNGDVYMWGNNDYGQLGIGDLDSRSIPIKVLSNVDIIAVGSYHAHALRSDGFVWSWGRNDTGQLANGSMANRSYPVITNPVDDIVDGFEGLNP
jgi:alpha-tubulin suppressor-like RCC1 family protein